MYKDPSTFRVKAKQWLGLRKIVSSGEKAQIVRSLSSMKPFMGSMFTRSYLASTWNEHGDIYHSSHISSKKFKEKDPLNFAYASQYSESVSLYRMVGIKSINPSSVSRSDLVHDFFPEPTSSLKKELREDRITSSVGAGFGLMWVAKNTQTNLYYLTKVYDKLRLSHSDSYSRRKIVESILLERRILEGIRNPFLLSALATMQDDRNLYIVLDYQEGETMEDMLLREGRLSEGAAIFFIAEIIEAVSFLHINEISHRAIAPETVSIKKDGHIILTDFSACKANITNPISGCTTICGREPYSAPEVQFVGLKGYGLAADWWSVGVLIYKMLIGKVPIPTIMVPNLEGVMEDIFDTIPTYVSIPARDFMKSLLCLDPALRLGSAETGISEIKEHEMFSHLDWMVIARQGYCSPYELPEKELLDLNFLFFGGDEDMFYPHTSELLMSD
jgi:serine/threonine protein kinase